MVCIELINSGEMKTLSTPACVPDDSTYKVLSLQLRMQPMWTQGSEKPGALPGPVFATHWVEAAWASLNQSFRAGLRTWAQRFLFPHSRLFRS